MLRFAIEFGMSPASWSRVHVAGVPEPKLPDDEAFLAGRGLRLV